MAEVFFKIEKKVTNLSFSVEKIVGKNAAATADTVDAALNDFEVQDTITKADEFIGVGKKRFSIVAIRSFLRSYFSETGHAHSFESLSDKPPIDDLVSKVPGKSLISDTEIIRLASVINYDDRLILLELAKKINASETLSAVEIQLLVSNFVDSSPEIIKAVEDVRIALANDAALENSLVTLLAKKVDAVTGKSLISDTEIIRLSSVINYDDTALRAVVSNLKASDIAETSTRFWLTDVLRDKLNAFTSNFTAELKTAYDTAVNYAHSHLNSSVLSAITQGVVDGWNSAVEHIGSTIMHTNDTERTVWNNKADQNGTILYHSTKWFTPVGTVSVVGNQVTSNSTEFSSNMIGAKLIINGENRVITARVGAVATVNSDYSQNYTNVPSTNWGVYNKAIVINSSGITFFIVNSSSSSYFNFHQTNGFTYQYGILSPQNAFYLTDAVLKVKNNYPLTWSATASYAGAPDLGICRYAPGVMEINNGTTGQYRDLRARSVIETGVVEYADNAAATAAGLFAGQKYRTGDLLKIVH